MSIVIVGTGERSQRFYRILKTLEKDVVGVLSSFDRKEDISGFDDTPVFSINDPPPAERALVISKLGTNLERVLKVDGIYKQIYVEKPLFLISKQATPQFKSQINVLYNRRFYNTVQFLKEKTRTCRIKNIDVLYTEDIRDKQLRYPEINQQDIPTIFFVHLIDIIQYLVGDMNIVWKSNRRDMFGGLPAVALQADHAEITIHVAPDIGSVSQIRGWFEDGMYFELAPLEYLRVWKRGDTSVVDNQRQYHITQAEEIREVGAGLIPMIESMFRPSDTFCTASEEEKKIELLREWYRD